MSSIKITVAIVSILAFFLSFMAQSASLYKEDFSNSPPSAWKQANMSWVKSTKKLKVDYKIYNHGGKNGSYPKNVSSANFTRAVEATLKYKINLDKNYKTNIGGKFFGLGPKNHITGCKNITNKGWSARVGIRDHKPQLYIYDQSKSNGDCGAIIKSSKTLKTDKWYNIALYVKLNSRGNKSDAVAILFVDGKEVARKTGFKFYDGTTLAAPNDAKIQKLLIHTFLGSINTSKGGVKETGTIRYDSFEVVRGRKP